MKARWFRNTVNERCEYALKGEFVSVFEREQSSLQRLAFLLTANSGVAKRCLMRAFRDCIASNSVSRGWALCWTRRMIIRNAISLVMGLEDPSFVDTHDDAGDGLVASFPDVSSSAIAGFESILDLPKFDRFVFVICDFERYSMHDCASLLGTSPKEISLARERVCNLVGQFNEFRDISRNFAMR